MTESHTPSTASEVVPGYAEKLAHVRSIIANVEYSPGDQSPRAIRERRMLLQRQIAMAEETGIYGHAFTAAELKKAGRDAAEVTRTDPVAEILGVSGDEPIPGDWDAGEGIGFFAGKEFSIDLVFASKEEFQKVAEVLTGLFSDLQLAFQPLLDAAERLATAMTPALQARFDDQVQQLKHGSAAICPKHGNTQGGFCRRCGTGRRH